MSNHNSTPADEDTIFAAGQPALGLNLHATEMAKKIGDLRVIQPEVGSPHKSIAGILDILELQAKAMHFLEKMLIGK